MGQGGQGVSEEGGVKGEGQGVGSHREAFFREQGQVCSSLPAALQEEGHIHLVLRGGGLESVRHGCQRQTEAVSVPVS